MKKTIYLLMTILPALIILSCNEEDEMMDPTALFTVTIENVTEGKDYFSADMSDPIPPGGDYSFSFHAGKGHYLSFATMFAQSNDLFYAPDDEGIALYDDTGNPLTGDITRMVYLWDAGTEVNQEPGLGADQAPRQSGPDTGMDENGNVSLIADVNDGFTYPAIEDIISVMLEHDGSTMFTVTFSNISDMGSFQTPLAPGSWVVHGAGHPIFISGNSASEDLESLAEDGSNSMLSNALRENSGFVSPFAPGVWAVYDMMNPVYSFGQAASPELEALAEDGNPSGFLTSLDGVDDVNSFNVFTTPDGAGGPAPIFPGEKYTFEFNARPGEKLALATMLVQSNDIFAGIEIDLFQNGSPVSGDISNQLRLLDAMSEINEFPGAGNYQAPRQTGPDMGAEENGSVNDVSDAFDYPMINTILKVTVTSN